jgi:hypothetical protein
MTGSESVLNVEKLLRSLHIWCDAPESMTHFRAAAAAAASAQADSHRESQSPVVARAAVAVAFFTLHHSFIRL